MMETGFPVSFRFTRFFPVFSKDLVGTSTWAAAAMGWWGRFCDGFSLADLMRFLTIFSLKEGYKFVIFHGCFFMGFGGDLPQGKHFYGCGKIHRHGNRKKMTAAGLPASGASGALLEASETDKLSCQRACSTFLTPSRGVAMRQWDIEFWVLLQRSPKILE